ncbi:hypothetical protein CHGG_08302 [Chaetomium globosum CBS 148.51]|uniref:AA1-like domain-containing protein n=1 Tax=Chaetomium globosum (strain ATCC 6205 / CBS 148.51 / DSM 1962 / NBRC 6347 / NRRL 1970) TaxID=306901 RepID=Q2GUQ2_CHAGB|nr:uncharacterized protein CHGG_08302 [Chaetomium globosum CBS 148.51]EAQ87049.1 hypothetical protein CHGG_08302 [Chaetomium globosum CBS 148.51]
MAKLIALVLTFLATLAYSTPIDARHGGGHGGSGCGPKLPRDGKCWKEALGLRWTVHGFDYHASYTFTNPAHQNSWGYVNFNLTSNVVPYTAVCSASSSQLSNFFYGTVDYSCSLPADAPAGASVTFRYSSPSGKLEIKESFLCNEGKATGTFVVTGSSDLTLTCTDTTTVTPDWKPGQIYSQRVIACEPVDVTFQPAQVVG